MHHHHVPASRLRRRSRASVAAALTCLAGVAAGIGAAAAAEPPPGDSTGGSGIGHLFVDLLDDDDGTPVAGGCFNVWSTTAPGSSEVVEIVEQPCDTDGLLAINLPDGSYLLEQTAPPNTKRTAPFPEPHVYLPAPDTTFSIRPNLSTNFTLRYDIGGRLDVSAVTPEGQGVVGACFQLKPRGAVPGDTPMGAAADPQIIDHACAGYDAVASLYTPGSESPIVLVQVSGNEDDVLAPSQEVVVRTDTVSTATMTMREGRTITLEQVDVDGAPVVGGCYAASLDGDEVRRACDTDEDGTVVLRGLERRTHLVTQTDVSDGFQYVAPFEVDVATSDAHQVVVHEPAHPATVRVRFVDGAGRPVLAACANITDPENPESIYPYGCDGDGEPADGLLEWQVPQGDFRLEVYGVPGGYELPEPMLFRHISEVTDVDVLIPGGSENRPPAALDDEAATDEDVAAAVAVLANDVDPDGDPLEVTGVGNALEGTVELVGGEVRYTPPADWSGVDSFTYSASDGMATTEAQVTVTVAPVNDAPVAADDAYTVSAGGVTMLGVTENDVDVDGDAMTPILETAPAHGVAVVTPDGRIDYRPNAGFVGTDSFTYRSGDGTATSAIPATVRLTVVDARGCTITGTAGDDVLVGTSGDDVICALGGNDVVDGGAGNDIVHGDGGNDLLFGGAGNDRLDGGAGFDLISGGAGRDGWRAALLAFGVEYRL